MKFDNAFGVHEQALKLRSRRAEVLAGNIANADTPGYKARDFDFHKLIQQQLPSGESMRTTN
ncbi:MAG TPA: flagellar basal body rod protein FlgB, partial [Gammaproteobacteria bacterium]|nr:flagellar basal body rod protein FlgB [Gammaproteobacteria bacterium]